MEIYYIAQYGGGNYNESTYGDVGEPGLTNTGIGPLPGIIIGALMIIASLFLLVKRSKKSKE